MSLYHQSPVFVLLRGSKLRLSDFSAAVHASPGFREAVRRIVFAPPFSSQPDLSIESNFTKFALAAAACCNLRSLRILHQVAQPIIAFAKCVESEPCKWLQMRALDLIYREDVAPGPPDHLMRVLLHAMPELEKLWFPMGCISDEVAEAFPSLGRVVHVYNSDAAVVALAGGRSEHITELILANPSQGPSEKFTSRETVTTNRGVFEDRLCDALRTANLSRLRILEITSWGNGNNVCSAILHVVETCKTLTTLQLPGWDAQRNQQLTEVLSRTPRGLNVLRFDRTFRPYVVFTEDVVSPHLLMALKFSWEQGGIRGLRRLELCVDRQPRVRPLGEDPGVISFQTFCHERRIILRLFKR